MPQANHIRIKCGLIPTPCPHPMNSRYIPSLANPRYIQRLLHVENVSSVRELSVGVFFFDPRWQGDIELLLMGRNPANHPQIFKKNLVNNGINYQPQLVSWSRISEPSTVPITFEAWHCGCDQIDDGFPSSLWTQRPYPKGLVAFEKVGGVDPGYIWLLLKVMNRVSNHVESSR